MPSLVYVLHICTRITCKTISIRCPQGTRLLTSRLCRMPTCKTVNIDDMVPQILTAVNMIALARTSRNCKRQTRPSVRVWAQHEHSRNCLTEKSGLGPQMRLDTKTDWATDRRS
jgi:hypothetical protein